MGRWPPLRMSCAFGICLAALGFALLSRHDRLLQADVEPAGPTAKEPIEVAATYAQTWQEGGETVYLLRGQVRVTQGDAEMRSERAVVWRQTDPNGGVRERLTIYLEDARIDQPGRSLSEQSLLVTRKSDAGAAFRIARPTAAEATDDPTFARAQRRRGAGRNGFVRRAQFQSFAGEPESGPEMQNLPLAAPPGRMRRFRVFPRTGGSFYFESFPSHDTTPPEQMLVFLGGVNVLVEGVEAQGQTMPIGTLDLSADRVVIWTDLASTSNFDGKADQTADMPMQVYLEGNIIIRQADRWLRATQAFYDVREQRAVLLNAELRARIPETPAKVRVRAQELRQVAQDTYQAQQAWITTSEFGKPGYRLQASDIFVEPRYGDAWLRSQVPQFDPETGEMTTETTPWATTLNNTFFVEDVPVFYFPYLSVPAEDPNIPLRNINVQNDRIFGLQIRTTWDGFKLFGLDRPDGVRWDVNADYLSLRGPQVGTSGSYRGVDRFGLAGAYQGSGYASFIYDTGKDNLGVDRQNLIPARNSRGGVLWRDRQSLPNFLTWEGEFAFLSDRNWLEEYREVEFDNRKDYETLGYLRQQYDNWSWSAILRPRLYNYYNETAWLPRGDLYVLGEPLLGQWLTWSSHSYVGYATQQIAAPPTDPADKYSVLPFESNTNAVVASTRHEVDLPFQLGPVHFVPYALGEAAYWSDTGAPISPFVQESVDLGNLTRLYGSAGARASVEFWKVFPEVSSDVFNLNGLAHKMVFDVDYSYSQATASLGQTVPQFNEFDDNAQEQFRRRLFFNTWNTVVPTQFEPRFFAVRSGVAQNVTAPYNELVEDMHVARLGWRHRLQTKVGPVSAPRIKNWMTLDLETSLFPNQNRDNFGELFGLNTVRYNWYVGDRTTITAGTLFDTFQGHETLWNVGLISQRSARGSVYVGLRNIEGDSVVGPDLVTRILTASYSYLMSPKWISTVSTAYDLGENQNRGQSVTVTRVGADFLVHLGLNVDTTRNNFGVGLSIEPRFAPFVGNLGQGGYGTQLGSLLQGAGR
ncbi:MAG: hypothetical protein ACT4QC_09535 [Planctomycetaceae bacterium]